MRYEYDSEKSRSNKIKHGIDFEEAQALWEDTKRLQAPIMQPGEKRYLVIGAIGETRWTAIITYRGETVRIISVRRARAEEVKRYETGN